MSFNPGHFLDDYMPHGHCLLWRPELVWTHVISDALTALAYFSIPVALVYFVRRRQDLEFSWIFALFAAFILACGLTHVMGVWTLWNGDYGIQAIVKAVTAVVSVLTAIVLWPLVPKALALPSTLELRSANESLAARIAERDVALEQLKVEVAEREKAEAALAQSQKIDAIGQLTGGIAHDFNNLLQAASGNLELVKGRVEGDKHVDRWLANAAGAVERGKDLTSRLLAFSRTQKLELRPIEAEPVLENITELLRRTLGPQISLQLVLDEEPHTVLADKTQLEMAVLNLAINARDAMPEGGSLRIEVVPAPDERFTDIRVTDTGTGIDPAVADRVFEPFFTTKETGKGTGLGLSMVFGMAEQSGGTVFFDSTPGEGTTVTVRLRRADRGLRSSDEESSDTPAPPARLPEMRVLLVDDDADVRGTVAEMLAGLGCLVHEADGAEKAIALLDPSQADLAILDFAMPGTNGAELARRLSAERPGLPVVFVSGHADTDALEAALGRNFQLLRKPFSEHELAATIRAALKLP